MVFDVPGLLSIPDGVPLEWVALWENPHKMVVEEEKRLTWSFVPETLGLEGFSLLSIPCIAITVTAGILIFLVKKRA